MITVSTPTHNNVVFILSTHCC